MLWFSVAMCSHLQGATYTDFTEGSSLLGTIYLQKAMLAVLRHSCSLCTHAPNRPSSTTDLQKTRAFTCCSSECCLNASHLLLLWASHFLGFPHIVCYSKAISPVSLSVVGLFYGLNDGTLRIWEEGSLARFPG